MQEVTPWGNKVQSLTSTMLVMLGVCDAASDIVLLRKAWELNAPDQGPAPQEAPKRRVTMRDYLSSSRGKGDYTSFGPASHESPQPKPTENLTVEEGKTRANQRVEQPQVVPKAAEQPAQQDAQDGGNVGQDD